MCVHTASHGLLAANNCCSVMLVRPIKWKMMSSISSSADKAHSQSEHASWRLSEDNIPPPHRFITVATVRGCYDRAGARSSTTGWILMHSYAAVLIWPIKWPAQQTLTLGLSYSAGNTHKHLQHADRGLSKYNIPLLSHCRERAAVR